MPLGRGERIGEAYVRIIADGSGMRESIRDALDDEGVFDEFEESGRKTSARWREGFEKEMAKAPNQTKLRDAIAGPLARGNWLSQEFFRSRNWTNFRSSLEKEFGEAGRRAGVRLENELLAGTLDFDRLSSRLENILPTITREQQAMMREHQQEMNRIQRLGAMQAAAYAEDERRTIRQRSQALRKLREDFAFLNREAGQLFAGSAEAQPKSVLSEKVRVIREEMDRLGVENSVWVENLRDVEFRLRRTRPELDRLIVNLDRTSFFVGKAFGRGSRNDFLNFIGVVASGVTRLTTTILPRALRGLLNYRLRLADAFQVGGISGLARVLGVDLLKGVAAVGAGFAGLIGIIGPLLSIMSLLVGVVTALASSLSFALVGALGAAAGAFAPVVSAAGVMVLAFQNATKEAKQAGREIADAFSGLGDVAAGAVFRNVTEQAERLIGVLGNLRPVVRRIGLAISSVGDFALDMLEGPGFQRFRDEMVRFLPGAVRSLGRSLVQTFGGLGGILVGLIPLTERFLRWLEDATRRFNDWANSAEGRNSIKDFFDRAGDSAATFFDFLGSVVDLFGTLVNAGRGAGDSLFGSMTRAIDRWNQTLRDNPDILRQWFNDARDFGRELGNVLEGFGRIFGALDNALSRGIVIDVFRLLGNSLEVIADIIGPVVRLFNQLSDATGGLSTQVALAAAVLPRLNGALAGVKGSLAGFSGASGSAIGAMARFQGAVRGLAGVGGLVTLAAAADTSNGALGTLASAGGGALLGFSLGGPIGAAIGAGAGALLGLASAGDKAGNSMAEAEPPTADYASTLNKLTGAATQATRELAFMSAEQSGLAKDARSLGIDNRTLVDAMLGSAKAANRVEQALRRAGQESEFARLKANGFRADLRAAAGDFNVQREAVQRLTGATANYKTLVKAGLPKQLATRIVAKGLPQTIDEFSFLLRQYSLNPKEVRTLAKLSGFSLASRGMKELIALAKDLDKQEPTPEADLDKKKFDANNKSVNRDLDALGRRVARPGVDVETSRARGQILSVEQWLNSIQDEIVYVNVERRYRGVQKFTAEGGIFDGMQSRIIAEAGPEAVVPLNRPLSEVDPAVRWLSAIAQGKAVVGSPAPSKVIDVGGITVNSPSADPEAVAAATINHLVASAYF